MYSGWPGDRVKAIFWTRPPSCPVPTQLAIVAGNKIIAEANIGGITPAIFILRGK